MYVAGLYSTFIFKKSNRVVRPSSYLDYLVSTDGFQFDKDLEKRSLKADSSPEMSLDYLITFESTPQESSPRSKRGVFPLSSGEELICSPEDTSDAARLKMEPPPVGTVQDSVSPTGRVCESHPQVTDTPLFDHFSPTVKVLSDTDHQLHFQNLDHFVEEKVSELEERNTSAAASPEEDFEGVQEYFERQEEEKETELQAGENCDDQHLEDEMPHEETVQEEVAASPERASTSKKGKKKKKKRTARFCSTVIDPAVTGQTCSVNYQSEVEQDVVHDRELEDDLSVPEPPPFQVYQRKKRAEAGLSDIVIQEASFSTNTGSLRALRPRKYSSVVDPKLTPGRQS